MIRMRVILKYCVSVVLYFFILFFNCLDTGYWNANSKWIWWNVWFAMCIHCAYHGVHFSLSSNTLFVIKFPKIFSINLFWYIITVNVVIWFDCQCLVFIAFNNTHVYANLDEKTKNENKKKFEMTHIFNWIYVSIYIIHMPFAFGVRNVSIERCLNQQTHLKRMKNKNYIFTKNLCTMLEAYSLLNFSLYNEFFVVVVVVVIFVQFFVLRWLNLYPIDK